MVYYNNVNIGHIDIHNILVLHLFEGFLDGVFRGQPDFDKGSDVCK
jgi:hypothetical protein